MRTLPANPMFENFILQILLEIGFLGDVLEIKTKVGV